MKSIRGAITVEKNSEEAIIKNSEILLNKIILENNLNNEDIFSIIFSTTNDLTKIAPAKAARNLGFTDIGLMCFNEMNVENSLKKCIRIMIFVNKDINKKDIKHIYLKGATILRPDLIEQI